MARPATRPRHRPHAWRLLPVLLGGARQLGVLALALATAASAVWVVDTVHTVRLTHARLHEAQQSRDHLLEERGRLLLERSAWSGYGRVEQVAREDLGMRVPDPDNTRVLVLSADPEVGP